MVCLVCPASPLSESSSTAQTDWRFMTPNVRALYAWAKQQMPEVFKVFEENTLQPRFEAQQALRDFKESMEDWLDPSWYTMAGLVVVGLTADRENAIADQVDELMSIAVGYNKQLSSVIKGVRDTGQFNRAGLAEIDGIGAFSLSAEGSKELWEKVYKLIEAHFEGSVDAQGEIQEAEKNIAQFSQGDLSAQEYISKYAILVRKLLRAGGQITEQRKIQLCLQGAKAG